MLQSPIRVEQRLAAAGDKVVRKEEDMASLSEGSVRSSPGRQDLRGGAASEILSLLDVSPSSVIDSSIAPCHPRQGMASQDAHESHFKQTTLTADDKNVRGLTICFRRLLLMVLYLFFVDKFGGRQFFLQQ